MKLNIPFLAFWLCTFFSQSLFAQINQYNEVIENFNKDTTTNQWVASGSACLTASTQNTSSSVPSGVIPGCVDALGHSNFYYQTAGEPTYDRHGNMTQGVSTLVGGYDGTFSHDYKDPILGLGALRLTNGDLRLGQNPNIHPGQNSFQQIGTVYSFHPFIEPQDFNVTFVTTTYGGNGYEPGLGDPTCPVSTNLATCFTDYQHTGSAGILFFIADTLAYPSPVAPLPYTLTFGSFGGSLGYDCSPENKRNNPNDSVGGMVGGFLGVGISESGYFPWGYNNGWQNDPYATKFFPNTISVRGPGNITDDNFSNAKINPASGPISSTDLVCQFNFYTTSATATNPTSSTVSASGLPTNTSITPGDTIVSTSNGLMVVSTPTTNAVPNTVQITTYTKKGSNYDKLIGTYPIATTLPGSIALQDYQLLGAVHPLPLDSNSHPQQIASQEATSASKDPSQLPSRQKAIPITYSITLTTSGELSVFYSYNNGWMIPVVKQLNIGTPPQSFIYGFAGSTGAGSNIHEVSCFKAIQNTQSGSSASGTAKDVLKPSQTNKEVFFAGYNPSLLTGTLRAFAISLQGDGSASLASSPTWDASCSLTGTTSPNSQAYMSQLCSGLSATGQVYTTRHIATVNAVTSGGTTAFSGIEFKYPNLSQDQQSSLNDDSNGQFRVKYISGDTSQEAGGNIVSGPIFRPRYSLLGDIENSGPTAALPPSLNLDSSWKDLLNSSDDTATEGALYSGSSSTFKSSNSARTNVVYVGANDGMLHGFNAGNSTIPGDGSELFAYVPSQVINTIHQAGDSSLDFSGVGYAHNAYVDATPAIGDAYFNGSWHTLLVNGLGDGGNAGGVINSLSATNATGSIFALDITNPNLFSSNSFSTVVLGDWSSATITCGTMSSNTSGSCGNYMGSLTGTPIIRRLHNGNWAAIFGNGLNSANGTAGIFIMEFSHSSGAISFDYIDTGSGSITTTSGSITTTTENGITNVTSADLDGDQITDFVYAGDVLGNVWRFDLTGNSTSTWVSQAPLKLFSASSDGSQPISTAVIVTSLKLNNKAYLMVDFGTGRQFPQTTSGPTTFTSGHSQYLYGIWDSNLAGWNSISSNMPHYEILNSAVVINSSNLTQQSITTTTATGPNGVAAYTATNNPVCLPNSAIGACVNITTYGWMTKLPATNINEQFVYNPVYYKGLFIVNSAIPSSAIATSCVAGNQTGTTYVIDAGTGGASFGAFNSETGNPANTNVVGLGLDGVGSIYILSGDGNNASTGVSHNVTTLVTQTFHNIPAVESFVLPSPTSLQRLTWEELR